MSSNGAVLQRPGVQSKMLLKWALCFVCPAYITWRQLYHIWLLGEIKGFVELLFIDYIIIICIVYFYYILI